MSKVVMSLPKGMVKSSLAGGAIALAAYTALQFLCALLIHREVLGEEQLYPMVCVAAAAAAFLGCGYSVLSRREGAVLTVSAVTAVFLALTLVAALLSGGTVAVDGVDVTKADAKALRSAVAVVPQKALLFSGTILENLRWGRENASREEVEAAAKMACAHDFVTAIHQGYDTVLGQGGVNLSGGQKQRLALARALVRRPQVLILDDCTSALDAATEAKVLESLRQMQGVTVLLISQRIAAVRRADRILCLEDGEVRGFGTHQELMASCSAYQAIYASQIGGDSNG